MAVRVGEARGPGGIGERPTLRTPPRDDARRTRRDVLRRLLVPGVLAAAAAPVAVAVSRSGADPGAAGAAGGPDGAAFEETYRGHRIRGTRTTGDGTTGGGTTGSGAVGSGTAGSGTAGGGTAGSRSEGSRVAAAGAWDVTVDGRPLHLMRRADGTWLTMVDHYRSYPTPLDAARAAVDELGPGGRLREAEHHRGAGHGVHA
ncbi:tyrosinase family oxidase copper chaperone [Streptomyces sp. CRN 30]|uniref:tyrosinase family oxidase copper chaperone n=1 Tax=Streptomyces sp. CRN 30 TaxID=3075613 RepID=UPI002A80BA01|nr:tyrosinase family oxidase copper chaperone [Streptomyces sp. CRN 30]